MKILMDITAYLDGSKNETFRKEIESDMTPTIGAKIEDSGLSDEREIKSLVINYDSDYYHIGLGLMELPNAELYEIFQSSLTENGWKQLGNLKANSKGKYGKNGHH